MTYHDIFEILKKHGYRYSYEVSDSEDIRAVHVEECGICADDHAEKLRKLFPEFIVANMSNLNFILISKKAPVSGIY